MLLGVWPDEHPPIKWEHTREDGTIVEYPSHRVRPKYTDAARELEDVTSVLRLLCEAKRYVSVAITFPGTKSKFLLSDADSVDERLTTIRVGLFKSALQTFFRALPHNNPQVYTWKWIKAKPEFRNTYGAYKDIRDKHVAHVSPARRVKDKIVYHQVEVDGGEPFSMIYMEINSDLVLLPTTEQIAEFDRMVNSALEFGDGLVQDLWIKAFGALDAD